MKINLYRLLICGFFVTFWSGCSGFDSSPKNKKGVDKKITLMDTNYLKLDYITTILIIEKKSVNNVSWDELFGIKEFVNLFEHSSFYIDSAIQFLGRKDFTNTQKRISINSVQRAKLEDYIRLCEECKMLYDTNKISENILEWAINPNFSNRYLIVRNYDKSIVINILNNIKSDSKISHDFKKRIDKILTGESWKKLKEINGKLN